MAKTGQLLGNYHQCSPGALQCANTHMFWSVANLLVIHFTRWWFLLSHATPSYLTFTYKSIVTIALRAEVRILSWIVTLTQLPPYLPQWSWVFVKVRTLTCVCHRRRYVESSICQCHFGGWLVHSNLVILRYPKIVMRRARNSLHIFLLDSHSSDFTISIGKIFQHLLWYLSHPK